eukprot:gene9980-10846_t
MNLPATPLLRSPLNQYTIWRHSFSYQKPIVQNKSPPAEEAVLRSLRMEASGCLAVITSKETINSLTSTNIWLLDNEKLIWHKIHAQERCQVLVTVTRVICWSRCSSSWQGTTRRGLQRRVLPRLIEFMHASELVGRKIVVHGGRDRGGVQRPVDLNTDSFVWMQPRSAGFGPTPRYGHTDVDADVVDRTLILWSGRAESQRSCTLVDGHTSTLLSDGRICCSVAGERTAVLDTKTMTWFVPRRSSNKQVRHLYNHCACRASASSVFIFGGYDGRQAVGDFYVINIDSDVTGH